MTSQKVAPNPQDLKQIVNLYHRDLIRFLGAQKIFAQDAEDLLQDTWITYFESAQKFEGRSQLKTYIIGILVNKIREFRRRSGKQSAEENIEEVIESRFTPDGWWKVDPPSPDKAIKSKQLSKQISDCLEVLTETQRMAFELKMVSEEKTEDICNILGVNATHVGVLLFRAKEKLKLCLEGKLGKDSES